MIEIEAPPERRKLSRKGNSAGQIVLMRGEFPPCTLGVELLCCYVRSDCIQAERGNRRVRGRGEMMKIKVLLREKRRKKEQQSIQFSLFI